MNCLEYRRQFGADPRRETTEMQAHRRECSGCSAHQARSLGFELELRRAMNVPTPTDLAERILLAHATAQRQSGGRRRQMLGWGMAAAILLTLGVGLFGGLTRASLGDQLVDHMAHEPGAFASTAALDPQQVRDHFALRGVKLTRALPASISYAAPCPVGEMRSVHMVMSEPSGAVTVFYLVNHRAPADTFRTGTLQGRALPLADGTLVMLAPDTAAFDTIELAWRHTLEGSPQTAAGAP